MQTRFNRYMVECESKELDGKFFSGTGFNRYMVECEYVVFRIVCFVPCVLIDTWWNVNEFTVFVVSPSPEF